LQVASVTAVKPFSDEEVLAAAASLEQHSNHVVAQAIVAAAQEKRLKYSKVKQLKETAGQGLAAVYNSRPVFVGRISFLSNQGVDTADLPKTFKKTEQTATYVAINGNLAGVITFTDTIRPETKPTLQALRKLGFKHIRMITGDSLANAKLIAAKAGIDTEHITADALPADKLHALEKFKDRPVAFVGDGVNDAPVLTTADVGIALGARGSTVASESADIVIMLDDLGRVATAAKIAKHTFKIAEQSIVIGIFISLGLMLAYATGRFSPLSGAIAQEVVDVIVIFNALRAHGPFRGKDTKV
jgi:P-type E1-E2 ATPase